MPGKARGGPVIMPHHVVLPSKYLSLMCIAELVPNISVKEYY